MDINRNYFYNVVGWVFFFFQSMLAKKNSIWYYKQKILVNDGWISFPTTLKEISTNYWQQIIILVLMIKK